VAEASATVSRHSCPGPSGPATRAPTRPRTATAAASYELRAGVPAGRIACTSAAQKPSSPGRGLCALFRDPPQRPMQNAPAGTPARSHNWAAAVQSAGRVGRTASAGSGRTRQIGATVAEPPATLSLIFNEPSVAPESCA